MDNMKLRKFIKTTIREFINENKLNESMERKAYNKIQLLCELKMMESGWSAWTEDSYTSTMLGLDDSEIVEFMNKYDSEIEEIQYEVNKFYEEKVRG